jgi:acyl-coenzyme A synthetase/AMP-(fatty) acid ligase
MGLDAPETIERYQKTTGGRFYNMYGQTETSCLTTMGRYDDCPGSAGRPIPLGWWNWWMMRTKPVPRERWERSPSGPHGVQRILESG